jgi:hypothetical protein
MHAIVVTMGTDGDVFPYVGLGARLAAGDIASVWPGPRTAMRRVPLKRRSAPAITTVRTRQAAFTRCQAPHLAVLEADRQAPVVRRENPARSG